MTSANTSSHGEDFARWLADQGSNGLNTSDVEIGRRFLELGRDRTFLRHVEEVGTSTASRGASLSSLLATALERIGALGRTVLINTDQTSHTSVIDQLVQIQAAAIQSLVRGYASVVPINARPTDRELLLESTIRALDQINSVINSSLELRNRSSSSIRGHNIPL